MFVGWLVVALALSWAEGRTTVARLASVCGLRREVRVCCDTGRTGRPASVVLAPEHRPAAPGTEPPAIAAEADDEHEALGTEGCAAALLRAEPLPLADT